MSDCVFCDRIERGEFEGSDHDVVWFEPLNPVVPGHRLFVPVEHLADATEKPWVTGRVMEVAAEYSDAPCNLITSVGREATQTIFHLHIHYIPRRTGDGLRLPWSPPICTA